MKFKYYRIILVILILLLAIITYKSLPQKEYYQYSKQFYNNYFEVVEEAIQTESLQESLLIIGSATNQNRIILMEENFKSIKPFIPKNKAYYYEKMEDIFERMKQLRILTKKNFNNLTTEDKRKIFVELVIFEGYFDIWNEEKSKINWW